MIYCSISDPETRVTFREAVTRSISPGSGLLMPQKIPRMGESFFNSLPELSFQEIASKVAREYTGSEIPPDVLTEICKKAFNFPVELRQIGERKQVLELFHGPTAAFKDFGARFMAQCISYFSSCDDSKTVILVATSGDTGGAIASSFLGLEGIDVIILYPSGNVSHLQELQLTSMGQNITALEIEGSFDDCQKMAREVLIGLKTHDKVRLTSANSINVARLIPQSFYYYFAAGRSNKRKIAVSVPSGNFGNLTAAVMASKTGLKIDRLIAATNINKVVPEYLRTGTYSPVTSVRTIASAMDVGNPGNFDRLCYLFNNDIEDIRSVISGYWFDDDRIRQHMKDEYERSGYMLDPHGAVASLGLECYLAEHQDTDGIFVETAHPAKFSDIVESVTGRLPDMPESLNLFLQGKKEAVKMKPEYRSLEQYLKDRYNLR